MTRPISIKRKSPGFGGWPDYNRAFYADPPSHDFCVWLIIAELMRRHRGAPSPLHVKLGLTDGQLGAIEYGEHSIASGGFAACDLKRDYFERMLLGVMLPAINMLGASLEQSAHAPFDERELSHHVEYDYHIGHLVDAGREGHAPPKWQPPQWAHDEVNAFLCGYKPVVITLREVDAQPERNSNIGEWLKFAASIENDFPILFVRDTCCADEPLGSFVTYPLASKNAYVRAALYQHALVNMMVCNGPNVWCIFSDAPYLIFKELVPALPDWEHGSADGWRKQDHMDIGDQYPWASPLQRLTWTDDTLENITAAFEGFLKCLT